MKLLQQKYAFQEPQNLVLNLFSCPHKDATLTVEEDASVVTQKSVINRSKKAKIRYIRYKKIRYIQIFPIRFSIDSVCSGQFDTFGYKNACVVPMLHAVQFWV